MKDIILPSEIQMTPELGLALKNFRIENKVPAKDIVNKYKRASSYLTKLEKGDIKKVEADFFVELCDYITNEKNTIGVMKFVSKTSDKYIEYSPLTQNIIMNIDDLFCLHQVDNELIEHIKNYLNENNISLNDFLNKINSNEDISKLDDYDNFPENQWLLLDNDINKSVIKLNLTNEFISKLLSGDIKRISRVIAEGILYNLYKFEETPDKAVLLTQESLNNFGIVRSRNSKFISINSNNVQDLDKFFGGLEPQIANSLQNITIGLRVITTVTKEYGAKKIGIIENNIKEDLGFYFAYMSNDLTDIIKKTKQTKTEFLNELKQLIAKYSEPDKKSLDLYIDE